MLNAFSIYKYVGRMTALLRYSLVVFLMLFTSIGVQAAPKDKYYPMGVSPTHVYNLTNKLNAYADALIKKKRIEVWQKLPKDIEHSIRPMVVFQLVIATVEMFHNYELKEGMRPIPIITSSPIKYFPADIKYVVELLIGRMKAIAKVEKIYHVSIPRPKSGVRTPFDVYHDLLRFYMKMAALNGFSAITSNHNFAQMHRAEEEMESVIIHAATSLKSAIDRRLLVSSTIGMHPTGPRLPQAQHDAAPKDIFEASLKARILLNKILKKHALRPIPVPVYNSERKFSSIDVFIQSQVIIAELSELKRILGVAESSPVTKHTDGKKPTDVLQQVLSLNYMLERYRTVMQDS